MSQPGSSPNVLVAPLDWGLGHATRCIPVVRELLRQGCSVLLAAEGKTETLLRGEFPQLRFLPLPGYRIEYAASAWGLAAKIVAQIPKLLTAIQSEQAWLQKVVETERIDAVISDNRYGLHHAGIPSVFLTHQLLIKAPLGFVEDVLQEMNYGYINKFSECWVPDAEGVNNLAGDLSHPEELPTVPVKYIGPLSRFAATDTQTDGEYLLVLLSGPEPQRTLLENIVLEEAAAYTKPVVLVRGLPGESEPIAAPENITVYQHLPAAELEDKIRGASLVIGRCGYSSLMDLAALNKRSVLVPTPGQTEQEYLGKYLLDKNLALCIEQKKFRLKHALELAAAFPFRPFQQSPGELPAAVAGLLVRINASRKIKPESY